MPELHQERYLHLADVTDDSVLLSWGAFEFQKHAGADHRLIDDEKLSKGRQETIGARSRPYGQAEIVLFHEDGSVAATGSASDANHLWIHGLQADTQYRYEVRVDGRLWGAGPNLDWKPDAKVKRGYLADQGRRYDNRFRTHPAPDADAELTFAVLGDFGVGVAIDSADSRRQRTIARALDTAVDHHGVRLVLTTGDNVYLAQPEQFAEGGSGDEDDDWFFPFYQPYRYVLNRVPFYPSVGNHDASDTEQSDDRAQLEDNFFIAERFRSAEIKGRASLDPGLFYRFGFGHAIEFVAVDSTLASGLESDRWFDDPEHWKFLEEAFDPERARRIRWQFPYTHHPPFCAGPCHDNDRAMIDKLVPLFRRAGVQVMFSGHEHNFQYSRFANMHFFVSGAGGKLREEAPLNFEAAQTAAWSVDAHLLIVRATKERITVTPVRGAEDGRLLELDVRTPSGGAVATPFVIEHTAAAS